MKLTIVCLILFIVVASLIQESVSFNLNLIDLFVNPSVITIHYPTQRNNFSGGIDAVIVEDVQQLQRQVQQQLIQMAEEGVKL